MINFLSMPLKNSDFQALRQEYVNESEEYFRYMLLNGSFGEDETECKKSA